MTNKQFIDTAVENEFSTLYERNLVKCYLYYWILRKPETNDQYNYLEIAFLLNLDPKEVSENMESMEKEDNRKNLKRGYNRKNGFLGEDFETKFDNVEQACAGYSTKLSIDRGRAILESSRERMKRAKQRLNINYN